MEWHGSKEYLHRSSSCLLKTIISAWPELTIMASCETPPVINCKGMPLFSKASLSLYMMMLAPATPDPHIHQYFLQAAFVPPIFVSDPGYQVLLLYLFSSTASTIISKGFFFRGHQAGQFIPQWEEIIRVDAPLRGTARLSGRSSCRCKQHRRRLPPAHRWPHPDRSVCRRPNRL